MVMGEMLSFWMVLPFSRLMFWRLLRMTSYEMGSTSASSAVCSRNRGLMVSTSGGA